MAGHKKLSTRIINKHATAAVWNDTNFIPLQGELIIYDIDDSYNYERFKIGDGKTIVSSLPFVTYSRPEIDQAVSTITDHISNTSNPHGVTATQVGALPTTGGTLTGILYTTASTPLLIGKNGKVGLRAATEEKNNVGQINISNAWYGNGDQWGAQISAYNGQTGKYNELRVSHDGIEYNDEDDVAHKVLHDGNISSYAVPTTRKVNNKVLSADISLTASDVGAATNNHTHNYNDLSNTPTIPTIPSSLPANGGNADTVDGKHASDFATAAQGTKADNALPTAGGTITGTLGVNGLITQGSPSADSTVTSMNRLASDLFVEGSGAAPNVPKAAGFYLGKSATDGNRHMDIVSGETYSYIDFNKAGSNADYDVRLLVNVDSGYTEMMWGDAKGSRTLNVLGSVQQNGEQLATVNWVNSVIPTTYEVTVNVPTTGWTTDSTYGNKVTITVSGVTAGSNPVADVVLNGSTLAANKTLLEQWSYISKITTAANSVTLYAFETVPTTAFSILMKFI